MRDQPVALSLIMATLGRTDPIATFLDSIRNEPVDDVELLIVDQNHDDRVGRMLNARQDRITIHHLRERPGLSLARNTGAAAARGRILGFPDDDCTYPTGLIRKVVNWFEAHPEADGLSCLVTDDCGRASAGGYMSRNPHWITRGNVWRSVTSCGMFVRSHVHREVGGFDESLGLGAPTPWGAGEETEYILAAIARNLRIYYEPGLCVLHPRKHIPLSSASMRRAWSYGHGIGYVLHGHSYGFAAAAYFAALPLASAIRALAQGEVGRAADRAITSVSRAIGYSRAFFWKDAGRSARRETDTTNSAGNAVPVASSPAAK